MTWPGRHHDMTSSFPASGDVRVYDLAVQLHPGMTRHPAHPPFGFILGTAHGEHLYPNGITAAGDLLTIGGHLGTHVDALGHIACDGCIHGGVEVRQSHTGGLEVGSVEEVPPLVGRGHLVDGEALYGRPLTPSDPIGVDQLVEWFGSRTEPGAGDVVLVRTGWMAQHWTDQHTYVDMINGWPGVTLEAAHWLSERGILAGGSDTVNFEHKVGGVVCLDVHKHFLVEQGIYIMEAMSLDNLAADEAYEFTFFAAPLRVRGGTGSPIRPLAIVPR